MPSLFHHSSTTVHIHLMVSVNIFKTVGISPNIFWIRVREASHAQYLTITCMCKCVEECVLFVMYWYKQSSINSRNTDLKIMHTQCSNLSLSHGFLWCGPIWCLHYIIPAVRVKHTSFFPLSVFSPMNPIVDTGFVNYDFPFFFFLFFRI